MHQKKNKPYSKLQTFRKDHELTQATDRGNHIKKNSIKKYCLRDFKHHVKWSKRTSGLCHMIPKPKSESVRQLPLQRNISWAMQIPRILSIKYSDIRAFSRRDHLRRSGHRLSSGYHTRPAQAPLLRTAAPIPDQIQLAQGALLAAALPTPAL